MLSHSGHSPVRKVPTPFLLTTALILPDRERHWRLAGHPEHTLIWAERGSVQVTVNGQHWTIPPGTGLWIPAGTAHEARASEDVRFCCTYYTPETCTVSYDEPTLVSVSRAIREMLLHLADIGMPPAIRLRAQRVTMDLLQVAALPNLSVPHPRDPRIARLAAHVLAHPEDDRSLEQWSRELNLSVRTVARTFADDVDMSFTRWRLLVRVRAAITLLSRGEPVGSVSRRVGYTTVSAFGAAFRRVTGRSPGSYFRDGTPTDLIPRDITEAASVPERRTA